jgi:hypothetical protein
MRLTIRCLVHFVAGALAVLGVSSAKAIYAAQVKAERLDPGAQGWQSWKFKTIPGPSKSDAAIRRR